MKIEIGVKPPEKRGYKGKYLDMYKAMDALPINSSMTVRTTVDTFNTIRTNVHKHANGSGYKVTTQRDGNLLYITRKEANNAIE